MSAHTYTEEQLVEQPAIQLFKELGWITVSALEETFGAGGTLGRETKGEVVLVGRFSRGAGTLKSRAAAGGHPAKGRNPYTIAAKAMQQWPEYFAYWQDVLDNVEQQAIDHVVDRVPDSVMVMEQKIFVKALLTLTLNKLKNIREK